MATSAQEGIKVSKQAQTNILDFCRKVVAYHVANRTEMSNKMDIIDRAYARYKEEAKVAGDGGVDTAHSNTACDVFDTKDRVTPPIVVSQVDAYVAYLADVFLSGTPMFPVVSTPFNKTYAEQLETLLDDHASLGGYARQLLIFLRDSVKYNYAGVECDWDSIDQFSTLADFTNGTGRKLGQEDKFFNKLKRLNPRNIIRDPAVAPADASEHGDYIGYVEKFSMTRMKRYLIKLQKQGRALNIAEAMATGNVVQLNQDSHSFQTDPQVSNYINSGVYNTKQGVDWDAYFVGKGTTTRRNPSYGASYEKLVLYARIIPSDFGITAPQPNTPQIWRLVIVNNQVVVAAHRIVSAYNWLPILIAQPIEDGLGEQTQSIAEGEIPFQEAAETLFNIRFAAARRAVSDRALYNSNVINARDVNSKAAAPKIPVNISPLSPTTLQQLYHQIPFDMRGTETTIQDARQIIEFSKELHGLNNPRTGQFQKGNKSVTEWNDTMAGSDNRLRLPALTLEHQVFAPMKSMMTLNIFQYGDDIELVSQKSGELVKINISELRQQVLSFKIADGYTPKSKIASTDMLVQGLQMISTSPILQQVYGASLAGMFSHMMSLGGVKGLEEYDPAVQARMAQQQQGAGPEGLGAALLQPPANVSPTQPNPATQPPPELP